MLIMLSRSVILFAELFVNTYTKYGFLLHTNQYKKFNRKDENFRLWTKI